MGDLGTWEESIGNQESRDVLLMLFLVVFSLELVLSKHFLARSGSKKSIADSNWKLIKLGSRAKTDACDKEVLDREKATALQACELEVCFVWEWEGGYGGKPPIYFVGICYMFGAHQKAASIISILYSFPQG